MQSLAASWRRIVRPRATTTTTIRFLQPQRTLVTRSWGGPRGVLPTPLTTTTTTRCLSSSSAAVDGLLDILTREADEEAANDTAAMPADLQDLYQTVVVDRGWTLAEDKAAAADDDDGSITRLTASRDGGRTVQISFHCQDEVEDEEATEEEDEEDNDDDPEERPPGFRFTVTVRKDGTSLVFVCVSKNATCTIQSVTTTTAAGAKTPLDNGVLAEAYQGPDFYELAPDLQDAFDEFLASDAVGIDQDMAAFISMYADYKEQTKYVEFLERAQQVLR